MTAHKKQRTMLGVSLFIALLFCAYGALASWLVVGDSVNIFEYYGDVRIAGVTVRVLSVIAAATVFSLCLAELIKNNDTGFRFVAYGMGVGAGIDFACYFDLLATEMNKIAWIFFAAPLAFILGFEILRHFVLRDIDRAKPKATRNTVFAAIACLAALISITVLLVNMFLKNNVKTDYPITPMLFSALYVSVAAVWIVYFAVTRKNLFAAVMFSVSYLLFVAQIFGLGYHAESCLAAYGLVGTDILLVGFCTPLYCALVALAVWSIKKLFFSVPIPHD